MNDLDAERKIEIDLAAEAIRDLPLGSLYKLRDHIDFLIFCEGKAVNEKSIDENA